MEAPTRLTATLLRAAQLTPSTRRLTFSVPGFRTTGAPDEWVHVFLGEPGDHRLRRNYTIRAVRGEEVDVDVVLHEAGLMVSWVRAAQPGATLVWGDVGRTYAPPPDTDWLLLAGDVTALPAIGRILEELPGGMRAHVLAEVADERDRQSWTTAGDVEVTWLTGAGPSRLVRAARTLSEPAGQGYWWMAGETRTLRAARRWLRHERQVPTERWSLTGYWLADMEDWERRYETVSERLTAIWERGEADGRDLQDIIDEYDAALEEAGL
jgi:NADPH-dependent ferric siderophore reductase